MRNWLPELGCTPSTLFGTERSWGNSWLQRGKRKKEGCHDAEGRDGKGGSPRTVRLEDCYIASNEWGRAVLKDAVGRQVRGGT